MSSTYQELLVKQVKDIFTNVETYVNARKHAQLKYPTTGSYLELDIWIPELEISFEFQDSYHYITTWYTHHTQKKINLKDTLKKDLAHKQHITFIEIPCWWDGAKQSLSASTLFYRPDLNVSTLSDHELISLNPPLDFFKFKEVPDVGELMLPSFPMELPDFDISENTWWLGEKYDGMRCCWNPIQRKLYTRTGAQVQLRPEISRNLFPIFIDGEIWFGRGSFTSTQAISIGSLEQVTWYSFKLIGFDIPPTGIQKLPFEARYKKLLYHFPLSHPFAEIAVRLMCCDNARLDEFVQRIITGGGEGAILRMTRSEYEHGRSSKLIKFKTSFGDEEGIVVARGPQNSVQLKLPDDRTFTVPAQNVLIPTPKIGDVVTFSFDRSSRRELPVNPTITRVRTDLSWDDVLYTYWREYGYQRENAPLPGYTSKPHGYWSKENMRLQLESYAKIQNLNPLKKGTWENLTHKHIKQTKYGDTILRKLKGYNNAITNLFPELSFTDTSLNKIENRRKFFEDYAKMIGFDPQKAAHWYEQPMSLIMSTKGASNVIYYHQKSLTQALLDLFPNINLDKTKLWGNKLWNNKLMRRKFFENYARTKGFDALIPENWYKQPRSQLVAVKGYYNVTSRHNNDYAQALRDLFPEMKLDKSQIGRSSWHTKDLRRRFFEKYARVYKFDPLNPEHWYNQPRDQIMSFKKAVSVMTHYNNNVSRALMDLFPDIGIVKSKFTWRKKKHTKEQKTAKRYKMS
eukprot:Phypoly_transcript_02635.p1 GENE.Phypoly_transcript_02635~~Phypoly_transcript_02635.p1  ORF type:complete len:741 (+),score=93.71 Phypoly_transcript_02635:157-2379(+)